MAASIYDITSRLRRARRAKELTQKQVNRDELRRSSPRRVVPSHVGRRDEGLYRELYDGAARRKAPQVLANKIAMHHAELEKVRAPGTLPSRPTAAGGSMSLVEGLKAAELDAMNSRS